MVFFSPSISESTRAGSRLCPREGVCLLVQDLQPQLFHPLETEQFVALLLILKASDFHFDCSVLIQIASCLAQDRALYVRTEHLCVLFNITKGKEE